MTPLILFRPIEAFKEIAATAPEDWARSHVPKNGHSYCVMFCTDADVKRLNRPDMESSMGCPVIPVLADAARQRPDIVRILGGPPVIALDMPALDAIWSYWPVFPKPYHDGVVSPEREGAIFAGRTDYADRIEHLRKLPGVRVIECDHANRTYQDYVNDLRGARAVVNFCIDRKSCKTTMKARVIEACLAGAILLEQSNPLTSQWLRPGKEYLEWKTVKELQLLLTNLSDPSWGMEIAQAGQMAVKQRLSAKRFWEKVELIGSRYCRSVAGTESYYAQSA